MDADNSGDISVEELRNGLENIPELGAILTIMGVEDDDLCMVFELLDVDGDGMVSHDEFAERLYKMKTQEVPTAVCFTLHLVQRMARQFAELYGSESQRASTEWA